MRDVDTTHSPASRTSMGVDAAEADANAGQRRRQRGNAQAAAEGRRWPGATWCADVSRQASKFADSDVEAQLHLHKTGREEQQVGYEYICARRLSWCRAARPMPPYEARKRDAEALRGALHRLAPTAFRLPARCGTSRCAIRSSKFSADLPQAAARYPRQDRGRPSDAARADRRRHSDVRDLRQKGDQVRHAGEATKCAIKCSRKNSAPRPSAILQICGAQAMIEYKIAVTGK